MQKWGILGNSLHFMKSLLVKFYLWIYTISERKGLCVENCL